MFGACAPIDQRIEGLKEHLRQENPVLLEVVRGFQQLDRAAYRIGLLDREDSYAVRVPWWPLVAVLGTFSSGKSTFINGYLGTRLQATGNQAVDDKFTVICYSADEEPRVLPGLALDADPRFPFYRVSRSIEEVAKGEGQRIDSYLQLKTCHSDALRGKILIDSPGFDADDQRTATLRITSHIIDLSDLVLVLFDARHPEPGAMRDTLEHLVSATFHRSDANKFLFILNQIDNAAREDNPEEVFAAWQRALAQKGLTAGRFYSIYDEAAAIPIESASLRERFRTKRDTDLAEIRQRIDQVEVERAYRVIGVLEHTAKTIRDRLVPRLRKAREQWRRRVLWMDGLVLVGLVGAFLGWSISGGHLEGLRFSHPWADAVAGTSAGPGVLVAALLIVLGALHFGIRRLAARWVARGLGRDRDLAQHRQALLGAFRKDTRFWRPLLMNGPPGWTTGGRRKVAAVLAEADRYVQDLNRRFADPSGHAGAASGPRTTRDSRSAPDHPLEAPPATPEAAPVDHRPSEPGPEPRASGLR
jgi:hypothetical protein